MNFPEVKGYLAIIQQKAVTENDQCAQGLLAFITGAQPQDLDQLKNAVRGYVRANAYNMSAAVAHCCSQIIGETVVSGEERAEFLKYMNIKRKV